MKRLLIVLVAIGLGLIAATNAATAAPALRVTTLTLGDFGYPNDITIGGVYPSFTFNIPVTPRLRAARLIAQLHVSPLADRRSSIKVLVNNSPVYAGYVEQIGRNPKISIPLPVPKPPQTNMQVVIKAYLFVTGDICFDLQTTDLFMTVDSSSSVALSTPMAASQRADVADFFTGYGTHINVVSQPGPNATADPRVIAIPYAVRQIEQWHQPQIVLAKRPDPRQRNIVVRPGDTHYDAASDTLFIGPGDLDLITSRMTRLVVVNGVKEGTSAAPAPTPLADKRINLAQLGISDQTASGLGDITFTFPLQANQLGGIPSGLAFHMAYAQTPLLPGTTGMMRAELNGALIASRALSSEGSSDVWDIGVPESSLSAVNDLRITTSYYTGPGSCKGNLPQLMMTIYDSSYYSWSRTERNVFGIADFLKIVNGNVGVLIGDPSMLPEAFHLMSALGRINGAISSMHVEPFTGTVPAGYDYAFVFARPDQLTQIDGPLRLTEKQFRIVNPLSNRTLFASSFEEPVGVLELATANKTPIMISSYWSNSTPVSHLLRYDITTLTQQVGNVSIYDGTMETYEAGEKLRVFYASGDALGHFWSLVRLPLAILLGFLAIAFTIYAARRLTGGTRT